MTGISFWVLAKEPCGQSIYINNRGHEGHGEETKEEPEPIAAESVTTGDRGNDSLTIDYSAERAEMDSAPTGTTETTTAK